jgi:hypothetical protein
VARRNQHEADSIEVRRVHAVALDGKLVHSGVAMPAQ